jgi:hypothetical protein
MEQRRFFMRLFCTVLVLACTLTLGCGKIREAADRAKMGNHLKAVGLAFHNYCGKYPGKAPMTAEDLEPLMIGDTAALKALKSGQVVIYWGVTLNDLMKAGNLADIVLAYEQGVPEKGGLVLMADVSLKQMTVDDFKAAKKAKP